MQKAHPEEYNFTPQTWVLPAEYPFNLFAIKFDYYITVLG